MKIQLQIEPKTVEITIPKLNGYFNTKTIEIRIQKIIEIQHQKFEISIQKQLKHSKILGNLNANRKPIYVHK